MGGLSPWHLLIIAIAGLFLFFGWKQLPDMARSMGRSLRVFKTEIKGMGEDDKAREAADEVNAEPRHLEARRVEVAPPQRPTPRAAVVPNPAAQAAPDALRARPRPTPSPNGSAGAR